MPEEKEIPTSAGMETPTQTVERIKSQLNVVPVVALEQPGPGLEVPQVEVDQSGVASSMVAGGRVAGELGAELAGRPAAEAAKQQEQTVRDLSAAVAGRSAEQIQLEEQAGIGASEKDLADLMSTIRLRTEQLSEFDDETFLGEEAMRGDAAGRDITKNVFGAKARERRLQRAIERTGKAASLRVSIASAELMRNNIDAARNEINTALDLKYKPMEAELALESQFLTRAWSMADTEDQRIYDQKLQEIQDEKDAISDAKDMINNALAYATPEELKAMSDPSLSPQEQYRKAQEVTARGLRADRKYETDLRNLQMAVTRAEYNQMLQEVNSAAALDATTQEMLSVSTHDNIRNFLASVMSMEDLPSTVRSQIGASQDLMVQIGEFAANDPEGRFVGVGAGAGWSNLLWLGTAGTKLFGSEASKAEFEANRSFLSGLNLKTQQWASGAALTEEQTKLVMEMVPDKNDNDAVVRRKLNSLYNQMNDINESKLLQAGVNVRIPSIDLFEMTDLMERATPEQLEQLDLELQEELYGYNTSTNAYATNN